MYNDTVIGLVVILLFLAGAGVLNYYEKGKRRKLFLERMMASWGKIPQREYSYDELEHISQFFRKREKEGFYVDDITWNDLDMDRIFALINQSISPIGDEYLYEILRKPVFEEEELKERQRLLEFFSEKEMERHKVQALLAGIRKPGNVSVYEAVSVTKEVEIQGKGFQIVMCGAFFLSLLFFAAMPSPGIFCFLGICILNIITYFMRKQDIDLYLTSFRCVIQLLEAQKNLEKLKIPELASYMEEGKRCRKELRTFQKGSFLVLEQSSTGGGMEGLIMDYIRMLTHIDLIKFSTMMKAMQEHQEEILGLMKIFGYLDGMISIASFRVSLPYYSIPELEMAGKAYLKVENLYHPLLSHPVANSIEAENGILVTGSNASGKSTFLKNIAVNTILAQTIYTVTASEYQAPYFKVMTSMALRDDLERGESYFIVEIRSLKRILDETEKEGCLLCIIDEVLRGTNTIERIGASSRILAGLDREHVLPFAATHDIELSYILEDLYENYHFEEEVKEHEVVFNYLLKKGRVTTRNAIRLLEMTGYPENLSEEAKKAVADFEETGIWEKVQKF
ncbi:MutS-related protein [Blautia sp. An81]|uniref:MutS-related protein n=1 Tax=Blautia sp. An81 TaxID=1965659 RepID=UPI000B376440|nr:DNA mismatch repair protein MutS [Blautia sp. An81]OUN25909.1 DNA mismatch repair protein MutS [Blautia sp. An81]